MLETESVSGHVPTDPHDAAYAIYTSGTTGNAKGVLHKYGNLDRAIDSIRVNGITPFDGRDRLALLAPMNFVASIIVILKALSIKGGKMYVVGYSTIKNPKALKMFFLEKRITITFLTPSYVRMLGTQTGPFLRMIFVGSEPANNLHSKNLELINIYACSESGFAVGVFKIDRKYETCPIGKPEVETKILLIKEDGTEAADGETGELCFENPFVRGYINLPEESKKAFVDGIYHTGDLARRDENGNLVLETPDGRVTLTRQDQIPTDRFVEGDRIKVIIIDVLGQEARGPVVRLSRSHPAFVKRLFETEIPEIEDGTVVIRGISRDPGSRSKIAVESRDPNVDPVGACIGNRGMRINAILSELSGEKIDVIRWYEDPEKFVAAALAPAEVIGTDLEGERTCKVKVAPDQLSLAIGKEGQNAKLAAKLTGFKIDIKA